MKYLEGDSREGFYTDGNNLEERENLVLQKIKGRIVGVLERARGGGIWSLLVECMNEIKDHLAN